jgi:hypothetical protein
MLKGGPPRCEGEMRGGEAHAQAGLLLSLLIWLGIREWVDPRRDSTQEAALCTTAGTGI